MKVIIENYLIFILIGSFLVFALIGYIIDLVRKNDVDNKNNGSNTIPSEVNNIEPIISESNSNNDLNLNNNENQIQSVKITTINNNETENILNSYNDTNNV